MNPLRYIVLFIVVLALVGIGIWRLANQDYFGMFGFIVGGAAVLLCDPLWGYPGRAPRDQD